MKKMENFECNLRWITEVALVFSLEEIKGLGLAWITDWALDLGLACSDLAQAEVKWECRKQDVNFGTN